MDRDTFKAGLRKAGKSKEDTKESLKNFDKLRTSAEKQLAYHRIFCRKDSTSIIGSRMTKVATATHTA